VDLGDSEILSELLVEELPVGRQQLLGAPVPTAPSSRSHRFRDLL
jgi:hypothetical protein